MPQELVRVANILADGRKVYFSRRGHIELMDREEAESIVARADGPGGNPGVYSPDLEIYGNRSLFLENLKPFIAVKAKVIEPETSAVDPAAVIMGNVPATAVGTIFRGQIRKART